MHLVRQRIALFQHGEQPVRERTDDADLAGQPGVCDFIRQRRLRVEIILCAARKLVQTRQELRGRRRGRKRFGQRAIRRQAILRDVDAIEVAIVLSAIRQVIDDLQHRTKRIGRRPG